MNIEQVKRDLESMIRDFCNSRASLLRRGRVERNITAELADILRPYFSGYGLNVNAFYNRDGNEPKRIGSRLVECDILVHSQGNNDNNFLVIELETTNRPERDDIWKLKEFTGAGSHYHYQLGLYFVVGIDKHAGKIAEFEWYANGRREVT